MEQELIYKNIGVIGCGASGGMVSVLLSKNPYNRVIAFDVKKPFSTLLPTGGGRCNITNFNLDIKEFVKNYPRGNKFLLPLLYKFGVDKTIELFKDLGIKTYVQEDGRVFPVSNSSQKTVEILSEHLNNPNFKWIKQAVIRIEKSQTKYIVETDENKYEFDYLIISTGGKGLGFDFAKKLGHKISDLRPSLCSLKIKEHNFCKLSGITFKDIEIKSEFNKQKYPICNGDIMFTQNGITGPAIFKVSALSAFDDYNEILPLKLSLKLTNSTPDEIENELKINSKKMIKNVFSKYAPENFINEVLKVNNIDGEKQCAQITKSEKRIIIENLLEFKIRVTDRIKDSEIVTAGGVDLNEINPKTLESKIHNGLYFIGEILNIDGYTGGYNLQNCWTTAFICNKNFN